ncbi:MAG: hypothetical protein A2265_07870, partial [Bacteroidetes bacterium RIFOXYA12_FULL_33_9]
LFSSQGIIYPIINQIPRVFDGSWDFYKNKFKTFEKELKEININPIINQPSYEFKKNILPTLVRFQKEWEKHSTSNKTWGLNQDERTLKYREYMQLFEKSYEEKLFLDLGAGTGQLTSTLAKELKGTFIGVDLAPGIEKAIGFIKDQKYNCYFIQADLMKLPFKNDFFDYIHASGVLHHTPNTKKAFSKTSEFVKKNGKLGVWLYRLGSEDISLPLLPFINHKKFIIKGSKIRKYTTTLNPSFLYAIIFSYSLFFHIFYKINSVVRHVKHTQTIKERATSIFDALAPPYAHKQSIEEVESWFKEQKFTDLVLTDIDNLSGFNLVGTKITT